MRVWVTRAEPGASATAARLRDLGHEPLVAPLLAIRPLPFLEPPASPGALAFTSRNGVYALVGSAKLGDWRDLPVFTVGPATAQAAKELGFTRVLSADGDVTALAQLIEAESAQLEGDVLHLGARELARELSPVNVHVRSLAVYEAVALGLPDAVRDALATLDAVLIHSPRAGREFALATQGWDASALLAVCISEAAAAAVRRRVDRVAVAERPTEAALLARLGKPAGSG